jgi:hypothetical protein
LPFIMNILGGRAGSEAIVMAAMHSPPAPAGQHAGPHIARKQAKSLFLNIFLSC